MRHHRVAVSLGHIRTLAARVPNADPSDNDEEIDRIMKSEGFFIDHVIYGVVDIDAACQRLRDEHGLGWVPGGDHLGGTVDRFVPLRSGGFLELLGVDDTSKDDGAWLDATLQGQDRVLWWCLGVNDLDDTAARRGLPVQVGQTNGEDAMTFRTAGMPRYPLPFFMETRSGEAQQKTRDERYVNAGHTCEPIDFTFVEVGDHEPLLDAWLGPNHDLPIRYAPGTGPGIRACGISTTTGEITLR